MKILIIRNYPQYLDIVNNTYNIQEVGLAKALIRKGYTCHIVFWTNSNEKVEEIKFGENYCLKVYYRKGINILKNGIYKNMDSLISKYDVIQTAEYNQILSWRFSKKYKSKIIIYHGPYYSEFNKKYNFMCKLFDILCLNRYKKLGTNFTVKSALAKEFLVNKGIDEKNITNVGVGIDLDALSSKLSKENPKFIKDIDQFNDYLKLLYIGKIEPRRNIIFIYDILAKLKAREQKVKLIIVGTGESEYVCECKEYAKKIGISELIYSTEKLEQKYLSQLYEKSDIFLLPTKYEIFGMVLLEAMYYKLPVLTTRNGGSDSLINNWENGIILKEDINQWVDTILKLNTNKAEAIRIGNNAFETINNSYTWDKVSNSILKAYKKLVK